MLGRLPFGPLVLATVLGIASGLYIFQPYFVGKRGQELTGANQGSSQRNGLKDGKSGDVIKEETVKKQASDHQESEEKKTNS
jgi:hypothetical protein